MSSPKYANPQPRRVLARPTAPTPKPPVKPRALPAPKPKESPDRLHAVTVKLPGPLLDKLDRLRSKTGGLTPAGRSTYLRWLLEQFEE
jgi:hypothetical protein